MRFPETFRPDKDLDDKTVQLIEESRAVEEDPEVTYIDEDYIKEIIKDHKYLNKISLMSFEDLGPVNYLIEDLDYQSVYEEKSNNFMKYEFWKKPHMLGESKILIRKIKSKMDLSLKIETKLKIESHYNFAILKDKDVDKFIEQFIKYDKNPIISFFFSGRKKNLENMCENIHYSDAESLRNAFSD
ncbi:MAG: hypothetical protein KKA79_05920 [Nanoarchaeota archaeon]|nr:hypothetical protein [Nanoarchaeota archaeon]